MFWSVESGGDGGIVLQFDEYEGAQIAPLQLATSLLRALIFGKRDPLSWPEYGTYGGAAFLPASRTGFMLTYKAVVKKQLRQLARRREPEPELDLPLPMVSFLETMATGSNKNPGPLAEEADFLEREALEGRLEVRSGTGVNEFAFSPRAFDDVNESIEYFMRLGISREQTGEPLAPLPIHLSSSLVTEIAPLVFLLRYSKNLKYLILEEPESHLHPHLQRVVAQVITRLIRKGVAVWLTTHSENFCQQINNFISLGTHPARSALQTELGYTHDDYLLPEEVGAYQLRAVEAQSELIPLETTELGIAMPSFNDELLKLAQESQRLSESREVE